MPFGNIIPTGHKCGNVTADGEKFKTKRHYLFHLLTQKEDKLIAFVKDTAAAVISDALQKDINNSGIKLFEYLSLRHPLNGVSPSLLVSTT